MRLGRSCFSVREWPSVCIILSFSGVSRVGVSQHEGCYWPTVCYRKKKIHTEEVR